MTATTLPTSRPVTQDWAQDFEWLNGVHYPNGFYDSIGWHGHNGIDYGCWEGDPVEAVCDGVIEYAGDGNNHWLLTGGGNALLLRNEALGVMFEYLHLSGFNVTQGQQVRRGQVIARSGNTGISTAAHLHIGAIPIYNVNVNNGYRGRVDPSPFLYGPLNPDYAGGAAIAPQGTTTKEDTLSAAEVKEIKDHINAVLIGGYTWKDGKHYGIAPILEQVQRQVAGTPAAVWATQVRRSGGNVSALQELADAKSKLLGLEPAIARIEDNTDPAALADLIPDALAQQVIDALAARLNGGK